MANINDILEETGLDYKVIKTKLYISDNHERWVPTGYYGTHKEGSTDIMGVVSKTYTITQNDEIIESLMKVCEKANLKLVKGGALNEGRKVYTMLEIPSTATIGSDTIKRYIYMINSHDGSTGLAIGLSNKVMSCSNEFYRLYNSSSLRMKHTESVKSKIELLPAELNAMYQEEQNFYSILKKFKETPITDEHIKSLESKLLKINTQDTELEDKLSKRQFNIYRALDDGILKEVGEKGKNAWGLFNGVTYFTTHHKSVPKRDNGRIESLMSGSAYLMSNKAFKIIRDDIVL